MNRTESFGIASIGTSAIVTTLMVMACLLATMFVVKVTDFYLQEHRAVYWGIPSAALVYCCLKIESRGFSGVLVRRVSALLGDSSYVLYLCHMFVLGAIARFEVVSLTLIPLYIIVVFLATFFSVGFDKYVDLPIRRLLLRLT